MVGVVRVQSWSKAKALELLERVTRMLRWKGEGKWWGAWWIVVKQVVVVADVERRLGVMGSQRGSKTRVLLKKEWALRVFGPRMVMDQAFGCIGFGIGFFVIYF